MIDRILNIWANGGWVMWPLAVVAFCMFCVGLRLLIDLKRRRARFAKASLNPLPVSDSDGNNGKVWTVLRYAQKGKSPMEISRRFAEIAGAELRHIDLSLSTLGTLVAAAPLVGLLGTVFGMLVTFRALAVTGGGKITEAMAAGISQALFPPEIGLCIAVPGLLLMHIIRRQRQEFEAFLTQLESQAILNHRRAKKTWQVIEHAKLAPSQLDKDDLDVVEVPA